VPLTILRTAAGSAPAVTQYKVFQELGLRVIAADSDPLSVGFVFADAAYQMPMVSSPRYFDALLDICCRERVDWILPALDEELLILARRRTELESCGARLLSSSLECLEICVDKRATYSFFTQHGIPTPATWEPGSTCLAEFPVIVKPRGGRGGVNVYVARDREELNFFGRYVQESIVQELMTGREMTIDVLADFASNPLFIRPRLRLKTESGISYKGEVFDHPAVAGWVAKIIRALKLVGPANIQCFLDASDAVWFTEINARLAGSVALTFESDPEYPAALLTMLTGGSPKPASGPAKHLVMLRYWSEVYFEAAEAGRICTSV